MFSGARALLGKRNKKNSSQKENRARTTKKNKALKALDNDKFEEKADEADFFCTAIPNPVPLEGKLLLEPVNELSKKSPKHWNDNDLMPIIKLLAGRPWIDGRGDNYDGACAFNMISPDFDAYLNKHDNIRGLVDPTYVVADVGGIVISNFGINNYPPVGSPLPQLVNFANTNYVWVFNGHDRVAQAQHLVGWLQHGVPNLSLFVFNTSSQAIHY
ncbi:hypothetical protein RhiirA1_454915 [Rhizophagus irregularis]|uniref:Uncharacterized protein n=1 Tax=Rhizophagus irregularis TaxID=588596 RepID=A0A2N0S430_9GLOM|nr:hypothetical protein RhiirA1_454915 [Rhizophagus irregularis]